MHGGPTRADEELCRDNRGRGELVRYIKGLDALRRVNTRNDSSHHVLYLYLSVPHFSLKVYMVLRRLCGQRRTCPACPAAACLFPFRASFPFSWGSGMTKNIIVLAARARRAGPECSKSSPLRRKDVG